jgi:hypothetical protein
MTTEKDYYYQRAEAELTIAQAATHPAALRAHFLLAERYIELAYSDETASTESPTQAAAGSDLAGCAECP